MEKANAREIDVAVIECALKLNNNPAFKQMK
jgi:hypothetical protein